MRRTLTASLAVLALAGTGPLLAQAPLNLPRVSPAASVTQTIGLTEVTVSYSRPAVNGRKVWGGLVPWNEVWRTGANENTTLTVSTPFSVGGKQLAAGTYGLHTIPGEKEWTFILSSESHAWGSFSYDPKEDVVRVTAVPKAAEHQEHLAFTLDDPTLESVNVTLHWEKVKVGFPLKVDAKAVVVASLREQLRGLPRFSWQGWNGAAAWCLKNDTNLDEAERWIDRSLQMNRNFTNMSTKAGFLEKKGDARGAADLRAKAMAAATEQELNTYGYQLIAQGKLEEALKVFERNTKDHPKSWNVWDSYAEGLAQKGDKAGAKANYEKALAMTEDDTQKERIRKELAKLK